MSGGYYDRAWEKIVILTHEIKLSGDCHCASRELRQQFCDHLFLVAKAAKAIEWNDSGDGCPQEEEVIKRCLKGDLK